jgi:WD40 repeat protein
MAPERFQGQSDARCDIYSLGLTLYELLTLQPPFDSSDRSRLIQQVLHEEPVRPRQRNADVPRDLETIVLKAMDKDPSHRYQTAIEFAEDLKRFVEDRPIRARRVTPRERLWRWCRRNPVLAAVGTVSVVSLLGVTVLAILFALHKAEAADELARTNTDLDDARKEALDGLAKSQEAKAEADKQRDEAHLTSYALGVQLAHRAWEENNVTRTRELLDEVPKSVAGRDLRGFEWYYLSRLCHSEALTLGGHASVVNSVAYSPDGQRLASVSGTVRIWDSATGKELFCLKGNTALHAHSRSVAFSPDGQRLAAGMEDRTVKIWDGSTGKELLALKGHASTVFSVAFSPDGQRLATASDFDWIGRSNDQTVKIWDSTTGKELIALNGHAGGVTSVAFSPDGKRLATGGMEDRTAKIWDSGTGKELLSLKGHDGAIWSVAFSPDGERLATGSQDRTVKIWDSGTGEELFVLKGHAGDVRSVAFSPGGQHIATGSNDWTVRVWEYATAKDVLSLKGRAPFRAVAFSPDGGKLVSAGNGKVDMWDSVTLEQMFLFTDPAGPDPQTITVLSPDGQRLAMRRVGKTNLVIWDMATLTELYSLNTPRGRVAFSPNGRLLVTTAGGNQPVKIWDTATRTELFSLKNLPGGVTHLAFSPDGQRLAAGSYNTVKIWDTTTGKALLSLNAVDTRELVFSPDGRRLAAIVRISNMIRVWDSAAGKELLSFKGYDGDCLLAFSPDGRRLATGTGKALRLWDSTTGKELFSLKTYGPVRSVAFSPDGQRLAFTDGFSINLCEATTVSPQVQQRRAANQQVANLFQRIPLRADVLDHLRKGPVMSPTQRKEALAAAQTYPEDPKALNELAWGLVKLPGRATSDYEKAMRHSEEACKLEPKNRDYVNTLGVSYWRLRNYEKALETLLRSDEINKSQFHTSVPEDLAFLAMTQHRLGHMQEAQDYLQRLRKIMKDPLWANNTEAQGFLKEAEMLLAKPTTSGDQ